MTVEFEKIGGLDALEHLQYCENSTIFKMVQSIIREHFGVDEQLVNEEEIVALQQSKAKQ